MNQIITKYAGVGEILAIIYDIAGRPCAPEYADRVVGLTIQELERIPFRIGIAGTATKALPVFGALRGGFFHTIITDEAAAQGVLDIYEIELRRNNDGNRATE
jgi:DNA-binding transcriptional regulator LsrR (DeoR family)